MKRTLEIVVVLLAGLSLAGGGLGACCSLDAAACSDQRDPGAGSATAMASDHCAPATSVISIGSCCADEGRASLDVVTSARPDTKLTPLSSTSAPPLAASRVAASKPTRLAPRPPAPRSPILRL